MKTLIVLVALAATFLGFGFINLALFTALAVPPTAAYLRFK